MAEIRQSTSVQAPGRASALTERWKGSGSVSSQYSHQRDPSV